MPRKDAMTGCEVMTTMEFFQAEGEKEWKSGYEAMEDMWKEIALDECRREDELRKDAKGILNKALEEIEDSDFCIVKITSASVKVSFGFGGSKEVLFVFALCSDGKWRWIEWTYRYSSGTRWEPPDEDSNLDWREL